MTNLPAPWQQFFGSNFRYRPHRLFRDGATYYRTNSREWAKQ